MRWPRALLVPAALLASCNPAAPGASDPVRTVLRYGGPPARVAMGERIRAEGRMRKAANGYYAIDGKAGTGRSANFFCVRLEGSNRFWSATAWQAARFAPGKTLVTVTGKVALPRPRIAPANSPADSMTSCLFGMTAERIDHR